MSLLDTNARGKRRRHLLFIRKGFFCQRRLVLRLRACEITQFRFIQTIFIDQVILIRACLLYTSLLMNAVLRRDYPLIQGIVLFIAAAYIVINLIVDVIYVYIDPRIEY